MKKFSKITTSGLTSVEVEIDVDFSVTSNVKIGMRGRLFV
jgi:hypothetical protein